MVILRSRNKITDFFMILAWASPFNTRLYLFDLYLHIYNLMLGLFDSQHVISFAYSALVRLIRDYLLILVNGVFREICPKRSNFKINFPLLTAEILLLLVNIFVV